MQVCNIKVYQRFGKRLERDRFLRKRVRKIRMILSHVRGCPHFSQFFKLTKSWLAKLEVSYEQIRNGPQRL